MSEQDSTNEQINEQMQKGIAAAKAGDKPTARAYFERVVAMDKNHEKGWFWLASVVESDEERRVCLGNVLYLNPNNERAKRLLEKLEAESVAGEKEPEGVEGGRQMDRRLLIYSGAALAIISVVFVCVLLLSALISPAAPPPTPSETPTEAPTPTIPPTWTPSPTPVPAVTNTPQVFPAPSGLNGRLAFMAGVRFFVDRFLPVHYASTDGGGRVTVGDEDTRSRGRYPVFSPDGNHIIYERGVSDGSSRLEMVDRLGEGRVFITTGAVQQVQTTNRQGTPIVQDQQVRFGSENHPSWSPNRTQIAFAGLPPAGLNRQIWVLSMAENPSRLTPITANDFDNTWPVWSPDGRRLVYVSDRRAQGGVDLHLVNADGSGSYHLTLDGNELIERAPDWSPDGRRMVFEGTRAENYGRGDFDAYDSAIYIIDDVVAGAPVRQLFPPPEAEPDDARHILPRFSPDGRYVTFTSNRAGRWQIYILEIDTGEVFQVPTLDDREMNIVSDWGI